MGIILFPNVIDRPKNDKKKTIIRFYTNILCGIVMLH